MLPFPSAGHHSFLTKLLSTKGMVLFFNFQMKFNPLGQAYPIKATS
jgi:hypothetical protein